MFHSKITRETRKTEEEEAAEMEEVMSMVVRGCKLARELEENLQSMAGQPGLISSSCEEIIKTFSAVKERVMRGSTSTGLAGDHRHHHQGHHAFNYPPMLSPEAAAAGVGIDSSLQEWLRSSVTQAMDLFHHTQMMTSPFEMGGGGTEFMEGSSSTRLRAAGAAAAAGGGGGDGHTQGTIFMDVSADSSGGRVGSSSQRHRRR